MRDRRMRTVLGLGMVLAMIAAIAIGCFAASGVETAGTGTPGGDTHGTPVDWKPEPLLSGGLQRFASYQELKDFLNTAPSYPGYWLWNGGRDALMIKGGAVMYSALDAAEDAPNYSQTNIQVEGVDEADIVKSDGEYIYLAVDNRLIIARAYPPEEAQVLCDLELEGNIEGLFINGNRLAVLENGSPVYHVGIPDGLPYSYDYANKATIRVYDVGDRAEPALKRELSVDGYYVSARMIGEYVYLVISGSAWIGEDNTGLPRIYGDNGTVEIQPAEIWHSATPDNGYGFTTIMSVNIVNDDEDPIHETLLLGGASTIYVSPSNIYITFTDWSAGSEKTSIHRIHIDEGKIEYHATGEVPGRLLNQFSMDEQGEYFRVATTTGNVWGGDTRSTNSVYVLDQKLDIFGRVENLAPGEQIYSARFMGSRCYLVTFKKVDPLFVIDLTNPGEPKVLGDLKITGYSDYLHPYDENHVIGIGKEAVAAEEGDFAWYQGVKISLFDVSDVANPKEIAKYEIGDRGTDSPVLYDHKAFLFDRSKNLLVLPVSVVEIDSSEYPGEPPLWAYGESVWQGAYVFDISLEHGLELKGKIAHCSGSEFGQAWYYGSSSCSIERSLYIGNVLYTISDQKIKMNDLGTLADIWELSLN
jgi:inhibitor of cysteine peptidase